MPSRVTVPVDSVSAGPAPMLTDITMPSVMPPSFPAVPPPTQQDCRQQRRGSTVAAGTAKATTIAAPASIIRNSSNRDTSASRGGRVTFARDRQRYRRDDDNDDDRRTSTPGTSRERTCRTSSGAYQSDRYRRSSSTSSDRRKQQQRRKSTTARKTPGSVRSVRSSSSTTTTASSSSSAKKNESVAKNRLESALRDQFDSSFTGSQGLSTLIGRKDAANICGGKSSKDMDHHDNDKPNADNVRELENVAPNILAGNSSSRSRVPRPNERLYKDRYGKSIDNAIAKHRRDNPAKPLRDYKSMSENEKVKELDKVGSLLARLGICDDFCASQVSSCDRNSSQALSTGDDSTQQQQAGIDAGNTDGSSKVDESKTTIGGVSRHSSNSRASGTGTDVDESRTTMGGSSHLSVRGKAKNGREGSKDESGTTIDASTQDSSRSKVPNMDVDESRTTLGANSNGSSNTNQSRQSRPSNVDVDESRTTLGSDQPRQEVVIEGQSAAIGSDLRQNNSDTIDDSRTTMDLACANDTTGCSSTRLDQSSAVFDFGGGSGGDDGGSTAIRTPTQDRSSRRHSINDHEDTNDSGMVDSPQEEERMQQQGITRLEESHFSCNADAGTVAETQGGRSAAQPKFLFHTQTPQFDRGSGNSFEADSIQRNLHTGQKSGCASHSNDTTAQSAVLLPNGQKDIFFSGTRSPSNHEDESCSSVEMPRSGVKDMYHNAGRGNGVSRCNTRSSQPQLFQSPISNSFSSNRKRLATTSGKRGADMQRSRFDRENIQDYGDEEIIGRIDDDSFESDCPSEQIESPSQLLCSSIKSPPSDFEAATPSFLAAASQSPILRCDDSILDAEQSAEFGNQQSPAFSQRRDRISSSSHVRKQQSLQYNKQRDQSPIVSQKTPAFSHQQSPVSERDSRSPSRDMENMSIDDDDISGDKSVAGGGGGVTRQVRIRGTRSRRSLMNDTVQSVNCTVLPRRDRTRKDRGREYSRDVAPADIHMKDGEAYRLDPLHVRRPVGQNDRSRRRASSVDTPVRDGRGGKSICRSRRGISRSPPTISFPDPLSSFDRRIAERLEVVSDWVMDEDCGGGDMKEKQGDDSVDWFSDDDSDGKNDANGKGVVISMTMPHIVGVTLKLIVTNGAKPKSHNRSASTFGSQSQVSTAASNGGTLIVLRSKEDLEEWEGALRERTCYSVLNHAAMSSSERKRSKTAGKLKGFQIVITTYDALKCRESSFALDELGRAVQEESSQGGWMASRSQSRPLSCEHLSVLHQLVWHRVIFMDVLGRQSYTAKPTTARYKSAVALNSRSRFIFFEKEMGSSTYHLEDSFKESRKQLCAVAATLHIPEDEAEELIVGHAMVDFRDVKEDEGQLDVDDSRYEEDESRYKDGQGYNLDDDDSYSRCHSDSEIMMSPVRRR